MRSRCTHFDNDYFGAPKCEARDFLQNPYVPQYQINAVNDS